MMKKQSRILGSIAIPLVRHERARVAVSLLAACLLLNACGQKGALYLPTPASGASSASSGSKAKHTTP